MDLKVNILFIIFISSILFGCQDDLSEERQNFSRLLKGPDDIEAVDFIKKSDGSGYIILGNSIRENNTNSNIILFNVDNSGFTRDTYEIETQTIDRSERIHLFENNIYIIGNREIDEGLYNTIFLQADLNGSPRRVNDSVFVRELSYSESISLFMKDFYIEEEVILLSGYIEDQQGNTNKIAQSFDLTSILSTSNLIEPSNQFPIENEISFDQSRINEILKDNNSNTLFLIGQEYLGSNEQGNINISIDQINDIKSKAPVISPSINNQDNLIITAACLGNIEGDFFFAGHKPKQIASDPDSLFLLKTLYFSEPSIDASDIKIQSKLDLVDIGTNITDVFQTSTGEVLAIVIEPFFANNEEVSRNSSILKFSFFVDKPAVGEMVFSYNQNESGAYEIIKILEDGNSLIIMSRIEFGTGETAIELSKVIF